MQGPRIRDNRSRKLRQLYKDNKIWKKISSKAMLAIDGASFDWSFMADEEVPTDMALMAFSDSEGNILMPPHWMRVGVQMNKLEKKTVFPTVAKINFVRPQQQKTSSELDKPKAVNTARPNSAVVNAVRENQGHPQKEDQGYVDSGCSRHMTGNMSYLSDFKEFDGGYVTFGGGAKGGRITGKGTLKTGKLDFEDVYFVKELQFNLFSVSQMCDKKNSVLFTDTGCFVLSPDFKLADESQVLLKVPRKNNMYSVDMKNIVPKESLTCLVAKATLDESMLWHRRLGHVNFKTINKLVKDNLVKGLPIKRFENDQTCVACLKGKQHKASCKSKIQNSITQPLFMLHMDLFGLTFVSSLMNKKYCLVVTDDYSRFTWVFFLASKDETSGILKSFITQIENLVDKKVKISDVTMEQSLKIGTLIDAARTMLANSKLPTTFWAEAVNTACYVQNRVLVVKPHNKTPYELLRGRTPSLSFMKPFGCHVTILSTFDHLGKFDGKSDDGFFVGYSLNSKAFRVYNIRTRKVEENLHVRFLVDKPIIVGDGPKWLFDIDVLTKSMNYVPVVAGTNSNDFVGTKESIGAGHSSEETGFSQDYILIPLWKDGSPFDSSLKDASNNEPHPSNDARKKDDEGEIDDQERTEHSAQDINTVGPSINTASINFNTGSLNINTVSPTVPTALPESTYADLFGDESELDLNNIATTYPVPTTLNTRIHKDHSLDHVLGDVQSGEEPMKVYRNKKDERGIMIRNKERLVEHGYTQEEGIYYDEVFALVARIGAIRLFLAYASFKDFVVYQMDVKSAFLYGKIKEEVYVCQPPGFEDPEFPNKVYKVEKALYGLHRAARAWYETISTYLLDNRFQRGQIDKTLFIKRIKSDILLVQVYVDDIIFRSTKKELCTDFENLMDKKFQMSSMGELTFFLGLQVTQKDNGIFISQDKYVDEILKKFGFSTVKTASTPVETSKPLLKDAEAEDVDVHLYRSMIGSLMYLTASRPDIMFVVNLKLGLWYPKDSPFDLEAYNDSDYDGASLDSKSTTGGCQFLGRRLISWQCKKQTIVANSTTEAEYVAAASCCGQVLWIQNQMLDYGYNFMNTKIFIDNESTICIVKNPVFHSKTKHIEIRHHFIRDSNEKKLIQIIKIHTNHNVTDLHTKAFDVGRF
ncbi:putative ribonuclease H-like domain-containing protein [Tanacetum coccineum]